MKQLSTKMPAPGSQSFHFRQKATLACIAFCFLFVLSITNLWAQTAPTKLWDKTIGGASLDILRSLQQTADGGYILGGWSTSNISGDKSENSKGSADYWVVKLNAAGAKEWDKTIGGAGQDYLLSLQQTADGGYILGGWSDSNISDDKSENSKGNNDYWVVKLNASGNKEWDKTIGGADTDSFYSLQQTADGGYILGGRSNSNISDDKSENSKGGRGDDGDYWVVKLQGTVTQTFAFTDFKTKTVSSSEVEILWQAVNEEKTASYELEKSADGVNFTKIATLPRFIHTGSHTYQFNDKYLFKGSNYYRIKQISTDGSATFSSTIQVVTQPFAFLEFKTKTVSSTELELLWKVVNETFTTSYELEKSTDGVNFTKIATLPRFIHDGSHTYQFNDKYVSGPSYYRLKQIATDGSFVYSDIINEKGETTSSSATFAFLDFNTKAVSSSELELHWKTVNEEKTASYDIEKSADGVSFTRMGNISRFVHNFAAGTYTYQFNDKQVLSGMNYYRIKQIGTDGSFVYSNTISYNNTMMAAGTTARKPNSPEESMRATEALLVYPNPAQERAQVSFTLTQAGAYSLSLYDIKGALVKTIATGKAPANQPLSHELQIGAYAKGIYLLKLVSDKQVMTKRMVIEH